LEKYSGIHLYRKDYKKISLNHLNGLYEKRSTATPGQVFGNILSHLISKRKQFNYYQTAFF